MPPWPEGFRRIPDADWTQRSIDELARAYDTVEQHGWYDNLDPTVRQIAELLEPGDLAMDYSGGTGILLDRLFEHPLPDVGILNLDSSPKFLRLCLEKYRHDERVGFRRLPYLDEESRLADPHEVLDGSLQETGFRVISSTNAIHLYDRLPETVASWRRLLMEEGRVLVQSGNIDRPERPPQRRIIDQTVEAVDEGARAVVREDEALARYREALDDEEHMAQHEQLRDRIFLPPRDRSHYEKCFSKAGFELETVEHRSIPVRVDEWAQFLKVYHQGVVGWVGGAEKVTGEPVDESVIEDRRALIDRALDRVLDGADTFEAEWTYWTLAPA